MTPSQAAVVVLLAAAPAWTAPLVADDKPLVAGSEGVPNPKKIKNVPPVYPAEAQARGIRGIVILDLVIDAHGSVVSTTVVRSVPGLDEAAVAAARQWRYEPVEVAGKPVSVSLTVPITFVLALPQLARTTGIPELRQGVAPVYPQGASGNGSAVAEVTLDADGRVAGSDLVEGVEPWGRALLEALKTWRFSAPEEDAVISFRVEASFAGGGGSAAGKIALKASGLRRADLLSAAQPATAGPTAPPAPAAAVPASGAQPHAPAAEPPVEVVTAPPPALPAESGISIVRDVTLEAGVPELTRGRRPVTPPLARMTGATGSVEVVFSVGAAGTTLVQSVKGPDPLKKAAEEAVGSWVFRRTRADRAYLAAVFSYGADKATAVVRPQPPAADAPPGPPVAPTATAAPPPPQPVSRPQD